MRVGIVGSRGIDAFDFSQCALKKGDTVVTGGARGVDALAEAWARANGFAVEVVRPDYGRYGRGAPHVRNGGILRLCDRLVAVWDGSSAGTRSMIARGREMGKRVDVFSAWKQADSELDLGA